MKINRHSLKAIEDIAKSSPGLQYVMMNDLRVVNEVNYGFADVANKRLVDACTVFNGNSVTKTFTAVAILRLVTDGRLRLADRVSSFVTDVLFKWDITIEQLLSHMSGLKNPIPLKWIHLPGEADTFDERTFYQSVLKANYYQSSKPGTVFRYSNINYLILGHIIEKVSGMPYQKFICNSILAPIGSQLSFSVKNYDHYAFGYQKRFTIMSCVMGFFLDEHKFIERKEGAWLKFTPFYNNGAAYGGLIGNAISFNLFLQALMRDHSSVIASEMMFRMITPTAASKGAMSLSWFTGVLDGHRYYCHAGGGGGHYCEIRFYPDLKVSSVIMLNRSGMRDERLLDSVDREFIAKGLADKRVFQGSALVF